LNLSLVAIVVLLILDAKGSTANENAAREQTSQSTVPNPFVLLAAALGATFLPWSFDWVNGFHSMIPGWDLGWGVGKYYFVVSILAFIVFTYGTLIKNVASRQVAGLLCLLGALLAVLGFINSFYSSDGLSFGYNFNAVPNIGIAFAVFFQVWSARVLIDRPLSTLIKISTS
jgi:hypothetical protein